MKCLKRSPRWPDGGRESTRRCGTGHGELARCGPRRGWCAATFAAMESDSQATIDALLEELHAKEEHIKQARLCSSVSLANLMSRILNRLNRDAVSCWVGVSGGAARVGGFSGAAAACAEECCARRAARSRDGADGLQRRRAAKHCCGRSRGRGGGRSSAGVPSSEAEARAERARTGARAWPAAEAG